MSLRKVISALVAVGMLASGRPLVALDPTLPPTVYSASVRQNGRYSVRDVFHATTQFPRRALYYLAPSLSTEDATAIAKWDYAVLALENQYTSSDQLRLIKQINPNIRLAYYFPINEANIYSMADPTGGLHELAPMLDRAKDFLHKPDGTDVSFWPDAITYDLINKNVRSKLIDFLLSVPDPSLWDDVFLDNVWYRVTLTPWVKAGVDQNRDGLADNPVKFNSRWIAATVDLIAKLRKQLPTTTRIVANMSEKNFTTSRLNGRMFEGFPNTLPTEKLIRQNYLPAFPWRKPTVMIVHGEGNVDEREVWNRVVTFTLLGDGYVAFDHGPNANSVPDDTGKHDVLWWDDQLYASIGKALGPARYVGRPKVYLREFEAAILVYNPEPIEKMVDIQRRDKTVVRVTIPGNNGRLIQ